jgi:hypothetical protein
MDGMITLVLIVLAIFGVVFLVGAFRWALMKMALRNVWRRKVNVAIVVAGLLIGTAIVTSSFVVGDTFSYIFENDVYQRLHTVDEFIVKPGGQSGTYAYFPQQYYEDLSDAWDAGNLSSIDALAPTVIETVPVVNAQTRLSQANANLIGIDADADSDLGLFREVDGDLVTGEVLLAQPNSTIINERLAHELEAEVGHYLTIHYVLYVNGTIIPQNRTLAVVSVVRNTGKANFILGENLFVSLDLAQETFGRAGMINLIRASNVGGVDTGMDGSEAAKEEIEGVIGTQDENPFGLEVQLRKMNGADSQHIRHAVRGEKARDGYGESTGDEAETPDPDVPPRGVGVRPSRCLPRDLRRPRHRLRDDTGLRQHLRGRGLPDTFPLRDGQHPARIRDRCPDYLLHCPPVVLGN